MDNFFINLFRRPAANLPAPRGAVQSPRQREAVTSTSATGTGTSGSYEEKIVRVGHSPDLALTVSAVYRAVELRAKTIAQMSMQYHKRNREGGNFTPDMWGPGKYMNYLLQVQPNPMMGAASLFEQITIRRLLLGNALVYIERDEYDWPRHLWLADCGGFNQYNNEYNLTILTTRGLQTMASVPARDVLHFANTYRTLNGVWGISTIQYAVDTLSLVKTESAQALEAAAKGGRVKLLIGEEKMTSGGGGLLAGGMYDKTQQKKYASEINDEIYKQDVVSLRGLDKVQSISMTAQEMQMMEILGMGQDDVARFFGTPRPLLMMDTNSHYTTYTNATMEYMSRTIAPDAREMEDEFDRKLLRPDDFGSRRFHLCEQPLLRMDKEAQAKIDEINQRTGVKTLNELRAQYDLPAVEGGDVTMVSTNLRTLDEALTKKEPAPTEPTEEPAPSTEEPTPDGATPSTEEPATPSEEEEPTPAAKQTPSRGISPSRHGRSTKKGGTL